MNIDPDSRSTQCITEQLNSKSISTHMHGGAPYRPKGTSAWCSTMQTKICLHGGAPYKPRSMSVRCSIIRTKKYVCVMEHLIDWFLRVLQSSWVVVSRQLNFLSGPWVECTIGYRAGKGPRTYYLGKERSNVF